jgi:hypothetical protein
VDFFNLIVEFASNDKARGLSMRLVLSTALSCTRRAVIASGNTHDRDAVRTISAIKSLFLIVPHPRDRLHWATQSSWEKLKERRKPAGMPGWRR